MSKHVVKMPSGFLLRSWRDAARCLMIGSSFWVAVPFIAAIAGRPESISLLVGGLALCVAVFIIIIPLLMALLARLGSRASVHRAVVVEATEITFVDRKRKNRLMGRTFPFADVRSIRLSVNRMEQVPLSTIIFTGRGVRFAHPEDPYIEVTLNDRASKILYRAFPLHPRLERLPELVAAIVKQPGIALMIEDDVVDASTWLESFATEYDIHNAPEKWVCFRYRYVGHL